MGLDFPSMTLPPLFFMLKVVSDALDGARSPFFFVTYKPEVKFCSLRAPLPVLLCGETSAWTHQAESKWVEMQLVERKGASHFNNTYCWERANEICWAGSGGSNFSTEGKNIWVYLPSQSLGHVLGLLPSFSMVTVPSAFPPLEPHNKLACQSRRGGERLYYWCTLTFGGIPPTYRSSFVARLPERFGHSIAFPTCCRPLGSTYLCVVIKTSTRTKTPRESIWDVTGASWCQLK